MDKKLTWIFATATVLTPLVWGAAVFFIDNNRDKKDYSKQLTEISASIKTLSANVDSVKKTGNENTIVTKKLNKAVETLIPKVFTKDEQIEFYKNINGISEITKKKAQSNLIFGGRNCFLDLSQYLVYK